MDGEGLSAKSRDVSELAPRFASPRSGASDGLSDAHSRRGLHDRSLLGVPAGLADHADEALNAEPGVPQASGVSHGVKVDDHGD